MSQTIRVAALVLLGLLTVPGAPGATLQLLPGGGIEGLPGSMVGWGFTLTVDPVDDGGTTIVPWLVVSGADFVPDPGVFPVGVFTPFITNLFQVVGPDPWSQPFDNTLQTGIGAYAINWFQSPGDRATGEIVLTYDLFRVSPDDPSFNPITDTIANGLTVSAPASVLVTPEPSYGAVVLLVALAAGLRRRTRVATLRVAALVCVMHGAGFAAITPSTLVAPADVAAGDLFGYGVSIKGNLAVVSAAGQAANRGAVYVYALTGSTWQQTAKIVPSNAAAGDRFGSALATDGVSIVAISAGTGTAYVFALQNGVWTQQFEGSVNPPFNSASRWPTTYSVAISGGTALVGVSDANIAFFDEGDAGTSYTLTRSGNVWTRSAPRGTFRPGSYGWAVALGSQYSYVGFPWANDIASVASSFGTLAPENRSRYFGSALSASGSLLAVGDPELGIVHIYRDGNPVGQISKPGFGFGYSVALDGSYLAIGNNATGTNYGGASTVYANLQGTWTEIGAVPGVAIGLSDGNLIVGLPDSAGGQVQFYQVSNISLVSNPPGRSFTLSGPGCGATGTFTAPYSGLWTNCTVQWSNPDTATPGTQYNFQNWADGSTANPRTIVPALLDSTFTATFQTQYQLTTTASPSSGGSVTGAGLYHPGSTAAVAVVPNPGFVFTGFSGALSGSTTPQVVSMSGPKSVTGNFAPTPPAVLSGAVTGKSGTANNRTWTIQLANNGPGTSFATQISGVMLTQTFGTACTFMPVRLQPAAYPAPAGTLAAGSSVVATATFDFSGCPANARFTVSIGYMSNGGSSVGLIQVVNQFQ